VLRRGGEGQNGSGGDDIFKRRSQYGVIGLGDLKSQRETHWLYAPRPSCRSRLPLFCSQHPYYISSERSRLMNILFMGYSRTMKGLRSRMSHNYVDTYIEMGEDLRYSLLCYQFRDPQG